MHGEYVIFDLETTGLSPEKDAIIEIGALRVIDGVIYEDQRFESLVRPQNADGVALSIPWQATRVHGITDQMVRQAPTLGEVLPQFLDFIGGAGVVAHNIAFDAGFIRLAAQRHGLIWAPPQQLCTVQLSRRAFPREQKHNLDALSQRLGLEFSAGGRHRSFGDVKVTAQAFVSLMSRLEAAQKA